MAKIALRSYLQKIESQVEKNEIVPAIASCHYILDIFPKNIKTYQVLSKAYLQNQDYDLAKNVFNIILRVFPDDFVSHIGNSIIAETNNNLALAIKHMKSAFENQPSNEGLQNELKRLYALNDGVEPNKILLTRGALIKMYLKGNLFDQVIAESKIGLSESPNRVDYQLGMAKSFFEIGDLIQSVEQCIEIVSKLPYCWDANEILNNIITKNHALENNSIYKQRLIEMDPYFEFMLPSTKSIIDVPDIAVLIDDDRVTSNVNSDFKSYLENLWNLASASSTTNKDYQSDLDWDSIITKAVESNLNNTGTEEQDNIKPILEYSANESEELMPYSRKNLFLEKLKATKITSVKLEQHPDWVINDAGVTVQSNLDDKNREFSDDTDNKVDMVTILPEPDSSNVGDEGVFDINIKPAIIFESNPGYSENTWIKAESEDQDLDYKKSTITIADTQPIDISIESLDNLFMDSIKALQGGNTKYALSLLRNLSTDNNNLKDVAIHLEDAVISFPGNLELFLFLGEVYTKLNEKEKALAVFQKAQKLITL